MELAAILTVINIGLALYNVWKEWRKHQTSIPPHPLQPMLIDIARAIREQSRSIGHTPPRG